MFKIKKMIGNLQRIKTELRNCRKSKILARINCSVGLPNPLSKENWNVLFKGPKNTPFEEGYFRLNINFPKDYPNSAPSVVMINKTYHPNISFCDNGSICISSLSSWKPERNMVEVILSIFLLLSDPNPNSPLNPDAANNYKTNKVKYNEEVKKYLKKE